MCKRLNEATVKPKTGRSLARLIQVIAFVTSVSVTQSGTALGQGEDATNTNQPSEEQMKLPVASEQTDSELKKLWYAWQLVDRAKEARRIDLPYARELLSKAVNTVAEASGVDSFEYGQCLAELGGLDLALYKFKDATEELEKARSIQQQHREEYKFHNLVAVRSNLATAHRKNGDFKIAERMYKEILQEFHTEGHLADVEYSQTLIGAACLYLDMNELDKAFNYVHDAQQSAGAKSNSRDAIARNISSSLARYHLLKKEYAESNRYFEQAVASFQRSDHPELYTYAEIISGYSDSLIKQAKHDEAAAVLSDKADAIVKCLGRDHPLVKEIQRRRDSLSEMKNAPKP
jgi:tetratricopeptide (TPR) repeat protein